MRSHYSLGKNGPSKPTVKQPKRFRPETLIAANKAINAFSPNGLFFSTNIAAKSGNKAINQMIHDSMITKK